MSCGLGAIILVFVLVKHDVANSFLDTEILQEDLQKLKTEERKLRTQIEATREQQLGINNQVINLNQQVNEENIALEQAQSEFESKQEQKTTLEQGIENFVVPKPPDPIENIKSGEVEYLIGLRVEGPRIGVLVDRSASMTDEKLIDIIRRKNAGAGAKRLGPKWKRTVAIAEWLITRVPISSYISLVSFSGNAISHTGKSAVPGNNANILNNALTDLASVVPEGPTNLQAGLTEIMRMKPTDIYLITDGLPTEGSGNFASLNPFSDCSSLWGVSSKISGPCRVELFRHTIKSFKFGSAKINVVLLPIEGDPDAAREYWNWTSAHNGVLISPAADWP
jgi:hypothetical protein